MMTDTMLSAEKTNVIWMIILVMILTSCNQSEQKKTENGPKRKLAVSVNAEFTRLNKFYNKKYRLQIKIGAKNERRTISTVWRYG